MLKVACLTDIGRIREINEDSFVHKPIKQGWDLLMVADGMGGHNAGEVASSIAVQSISEYIEKQAENIEHKENAVEIVKSAVIQANYDIFAKSKQVAGFSGMGTTVTVALISKDVMLIGHVGDSRAYLMRNSSMCKITSDHSLVAELVKNGTITEDEAQHHPQKNIITRALGAEESVQVDTNTIILKPGDTIMLCTDGLTNMLDDKEIEHILLKMDDPSLAVKELVDSANELGGYDNITVLVAKVACPDSEVRK
ncbi:MAG TPA: Stp1/IreP family PP2C-type Ser/Thr phosphatase [Clostridiaceae bacterium]|nr:Stp1/IreP family PP2C-type Ser/Thr phosphatase [Clostridiaceae bacterium]